MTRVLVLGGTGFIGRELVAKLASAGCQITVPSRSPQSARPMLVLPGTRLIEAGIHDDGEMAALLEGQDAVVNLAAILQGRAGRYELDGQRFDVGPDFGQVHLGVADRLVRLARPGTRLIHVSALGAGAATATTLPSRYLRSKAIAENMIRGSTLDWTIVRPSVVFGERDKLLNTFSAMQTWLPALAMPRTGARFQPVWVDDLASGLAGCLIDRRRVQTSRQILDAIGPATFTLRQLVALAGDLAGHRRPVFGLPDSVGNLVATAMEILPGPTPISRDNIASMQIDNVSAPDAPRLLPIFDIVPRHIEEVAPAWLGRRGTFYDRARRRARR